MSASPALAMRCPFLTWQIVLAGVLTVLPGVTTEQALEAVGEGFIDHTLWCVKYNYTGMLRSRGRNMRELLGNIDKIHNFK